MYFLLKGVVFTFGLILANCSPVPRCPAIKQEDAKQAEAALADFAVNLYKNVASKDEDKNQVMSPVSIALALALLENGADGKTRDDLKKVLVQMQSGVEVLKTYRAVQEMLRIQDPKANLTIANGLFKDKELELRDSYLTSTRDCLESQVGDVDFHHNLEETRRKINDWVSEKTSEKIPELFKKGVLTQDDEMVLANAIHFMAEWKYSFNKAMTKPDVFYRNGRDEDKQSVQYMHQTEHHRHGSTNDVDALEMSYGHKDLAMLVVLPKQRDGLRTLEKRMSGKELRDIMATMSEKLVQVKMPKFTIRSPIDLKTTLSQLGLESMFNNMANFSRMSKVPLKVGAAVHEAFIDVNENGTEAAAATGFSMLPRAMPMPIDAESFVADHPFLYAIVHKPTGAIVFLGKVSSVEQKEN